ncbi:hypothetical protein BASA83_001533 [Batrachochytrium salamandrivorans]|nr:hypothetical protein BASA83_001533 [Batrachochytrium salamandrivorans]
MKGPRHTSPKSVNIESRKERTATQEICEHLLITGHIRSYIEFFHMTVENRLGIDFTRERLDTLQLLLTVSEDSLCNGDPKAFYESKKNLAQYSLSTLNCNVAIAYYREALEAAAQVQNNPTVEIEAMLNLGLALEKSGQSDMAIEYYENSLKLAMDRSCTDDETRARQNLVSAHIRIAENLEASGNHKEVIPHYTQCLEYLTHGVQDESTLNDIVYRLGKAYKDMGQTEVAIQYLERFVTNSNSGNDKIKQGWAQGTLASCYESSGNPQRAATYLQQFVVAVEADPTQRAAESQACNQLGVLFNKIGEFDRAVTYFERHFRLVAEIERETMLVVEDVQEVEEQQIPICEQSNASPAVLHALHEQAALPKVPKIHAGAAQTQMGIARGNAYMDQFFETIVSQNGLGSLLQWKAERSFGTYTPI